MGYGYQYEEFTADTMLRAGRSLVDDINDRIEREYTDGFGFGPVGITAQSEASSGRKRFRTIPEE